MSGSIQGDIGRLSPAASASTLGRIPIYQDGELLTVTPDQIASGASAVDGPASSTDKAIARFDSTTGKLLQNSVTTVADTTGAITIPGTTNQLILGVTNTTTLSATAPAASRVITFGDPLGNDSVVYAAAAQTLTNKTITGAISTNTVRCSSALTKNASAAYANITGLSQTVVAGTYSFRCALPSTVANGTGGIKYAFNYTTTVLSGMQAASMGYTASAVAVQNTTSTTTQADLFSQAAVVIMVVIEGTMVVTTGGTIDLQMAQNTSNASNTITLVGAAMQFVRIA